MCGYAPAVDDVPNTICAYWDPEPALPPDGSACATTPECNLGNSHRQAVCDESGACKKGCFEDNDCSTGTTCSSQSALGTCG
jgi:hypothetical protein